MTDDVRRIADAVLYEGYMLWPYRRSALKNQQRWNFGGVYPRAHSEGREDDPWVMRTECLLEGGPDVCVEVSVRFLHVVRRDVHDGAGLVDELTVDGERYLAWEEAVERELVLPPLRVTEPALRTPIDIEGATEREELGDGAAILRTWESLCGGVELDAERLGPALFRLRVEIANETPWAGGAREDALKHTFCSTHTVLRATGGGAWVSLTDPPEPLRKAAEDCANVGTWPVLVGEPGDRATLLSSPIILEDHPRIAPESPGDLFDGGEIDQMLVLNILTLTDEEKAEMRDSDPKTREILERTEALTEEQLMALHGTIREFGLTR